jgi:hypothetical protein
MVEMHDADEDANVENDYDINKDETGDEEPVKNPQLMNSL